MFKKISVKYATQIVAVIAVVTLVFVPVYIFMQKSMYINMEMNAISDFSARIVAESDFSDAEDISDYLAENNEKNYTVSIYDSDRERVFTTRRYRALQRRSSDNPSSPLRQQTSVSSTLKKRNAEKYKKDAEPSYTEMKKGTEAIELRTLVKNGGEQYYLKLELKLKNSESIFAYTNRVLVIVMICFILVCGAALFILMNHVTKYIRKLNLAVNRIAEQDYSVRYEGHFTKDEVGTLAKNFNNMADTIQDNINRISNYNFLLKEDIDNLREYDSMRRRFVRNSTHELKTPLAIISSQVEMMNCVEDEEKRSYYYASAMEEIQKMSALITGFLKTSVQENGGAIKTPEIKISETVENLCETYNALMLARNIKFHKVIEPGLTAAVKGEHAENVFNNFITNAVKHTREGGKIAVALKKKGNLCRLSVYNDGDKIGESELEKVWTERYSKGGSEDNVGLGLFIVQEIANMYATNCGVINRDNGVEFWFDFR